MTDTRPPALMCSECHEPAIENPPYIWNVHFGTLPRYSHLDGEPLCAVMTRDGYRTAEPVPAEPPPTDPVPAEAVPVEPQP